MAAGPRMPTVMAGARSRRELARYFRSPMSRWSHALHAWRYVSFGRHQISATGYAAIWIGRLIITILSKGGLT